MHDTDLICGNYLVKYIEYLARNGMKTIFKIHLQ